MPSKAISGDEVRSSSARGGFFSFLAGNGDTDLATAIVSSVRFLTDFAKMSEIDWLTELLGDNVFFSGLLTKNSVSSSVVLEARQDIPNLEVDFLSKVLEARLDADFLSKVLEVRSSFEACAEELFNNDDVDEIEPILGICSSIKGLEPEGGDEPGEKLLFAELV